MNYPLISEYIDAIKVAEENFDQLRNLRPVLDDEGDPVMSSGNFAVVFKMKDVQTGRLHAVKCYLKDQEGRSESYELISEELEKIDSPYLLHVKFFDKELFVDTSQSEESEFPILLMDWVEGQTLSSFLQDKYYEYSEVFDRSNEKVDQLLLFELKCLPINFIRMASWLLKQPIAHGDIKPDNIIIKKDGQCVLVDYDGMFVPSMQGVNKQFIGTPNYKYPLVDEQLFDKSIDNYSLSVIALSLCAFSLNPFLINECVDYCLVTEEESHKLYEHGCFRDEALMSSNLFKELLAIYLHTLSQNKLDTVYFDKCVSEYLCPSSYDYTSTKASDFDQNHYWEDDYGVRYSLDGRKVIKASKNLKAIDYTIREGVLTICDNAFQSNDLHSITLPDSVVAIGDRAFANNDDMEFCNIPLNVKFIYDNNPWGGCFKIKKMDCRSASFLIKDGILYSSNYNTLYGLIYWTPNIVISPLTKIIASNAFWSSRKLFHHFIKKVKIGNVSEVGAAAFENCRSAQFDVSGRLGKISNEAFWCCELLENIDLGGVNDIPEESFMFCNHLKEVKLSRELKSIDSKAFYGCTSLLKIELPKTVTYISENSILGCKALKEINVDKENSSYCSIDGVLFNKRMTKLIKFPAGKDVRDYIIPESVYEIGDNAFESCVFIETIKCDNDILFIGKNVFSDCKMLTNCFINLDEKADVDSIWRLGSFLFPLKNACDEVKQNGYNLIYKAASLNYPYAQWYLARCFKYGWNGETNIDKYINWLEQAASNGCYAAMSQLGIEYITGKNTSKNLKKSYDLLKKLENSGDKAENECEGNFYAPLGLFYENGVVVNTDAKKAANYFLAGSEWDDPVAEYNLARCYEKGIGLETDLHKAKEYYSSAKEHKHKDAAAALERVEKLIQGDSDDLPF
jgi:serine/threonine protein kinase